MTPSPASPPCSIHASQRPPSSSAEAGLAATSLALATLYSKACYEKEFEEYGVPDVLKTNLDAFRLSMVAAGFDPLVTKDEGMVLLDQEKLR